jgi:hypothetical protein
MGKIELAAVRHYLPPISHQRRENIRGAPMACCLIKLPCLFCSVFIDLTNFE